MPSGLGIDIHPYYQRAVTSYAAVASAARWAYVKASDGAAPYVKQVGSVVYRPDAHVTGLRNVGVPVGVYHYAQFGDPVQQADVLLREHARLGANLPPMLDLEDPFQPDLTARNFAQAFLRRLAEHGHRPALYLSSSHAKTLRPDAWGIPDLVIWIASYGPNNGKKNALTGGYPGRVDIHQYTSVGRVPGINADVDLNHAYIDLTEADDVALKDETFEFRTPEGQLLRVDALTALANLYALTFYGSNTVPWKGISSRAIELGELAETPGTFTLPDDFAQQLADELAPRLEPGTGGVTAQQVADAYRAAAEKLAPGEAVESPQA